VFAQELSQPFAADRHAAVGVGGQVVGELRMLQRVNGCPSAIGRVLAVATMNCSSVSLIWRGRPPAH
jgi:hypothetical protein